MRWLGLTLTVAMIASACQPAAPSDEPAATVAPAQPQNLEALADRATQPLASQPVAVSPAPEPVMAVVNGRPIPMKALYEILVRDYGMTPAYQLVADELVRQEAAERKITVTPAEVKNEAGAALKRALGELPPPDQRERLILQLQARLGVSPEMWDMLMARQALLRKLVEPDVKVADEDLNNEFGLQFGRKWTVRDIQTTTMQDAEKAIKACASQPAGGVSEEAFAEMARKASTGVTSGSGGLLPTITAKTLDTEVPRAIREAAMNLKKPGDVSGIVQSGTSFHVLYLVKVEEPRTVKLEAVRAKLTDSIRERQSAILQTEHLKTIIQTAKKSGKIQFVDPVLKAQDAQPPPPEGGGR